MMAMVTRAGEQAAHQAGALAEQLAARHSTNGHHHLAADYYDQAAALYGECGCLVPAYRARTLAWEERLMHDNPRHAVADPRCPRCGADLGEMMRSLLPDITTSEVAAVGAIATLVGSCPECSPPDISG